MGVLGVQEVQTLERHLAAPDITNTEVLTHIRLQRQPREPHSVYMMGVLIHHRQQDPPGVLPVWGA